MASETFALCGEPGAGDVRLEAPEQFVQPGLFPPHLLPVDRQKPAKQRYFRPSLVDWLDDGGWR